MLFLFFYDVSHQHCECKCKTILIRNNKKSRFGNWESKDQDKATNNCLLATKTNAVGKSCSSVGPKRHGKIVYHVT